MREIEKSLNEFSDYVDQLKGDEKGEAQVFCDRLFQAFGHEGYKEAGAELEFRVRKKDHHTKFADLLWGERVLIEMKTKDKKLDSYRTQIFDYWWDLRPKSPKYCVLCNFDEFWIYDFTQQDEPVDKLTIDELPDRYTSLSFLFEDYKEPQFRNNLVDVTKEAADKVAMIYNQIVADGEDPKKAQRFILQCVVSMFAEDFTLLPKGFFTGLLKDCMDGQSTYDLLGGLFNQMNSEKPAPAGRFKDVRYFNGGLFNKIDPIELKKYHVDQLYYASKENWSRIHPGIFGTLFQSSMGEEERHAYGAHFTSEDDINKVVQPTIVQPWKEKINRTDTLKELHNLRQELLKFQVLDPACGSGNFLYVAFREMKRLEMDILNKIHQNFSLKEAQRVGVTSLVNTKQFHGIDSNEFAVELAKVTLMLGKELAIKETQSWLDTSQLDIDFELDQPLPLENLDQNIKCEDALFTKWPDTNAIIGNPPYQSKNKMQDEFGAEYINKLRERYPEIPGRADYCVYWFRKAHDKLNKGERAGLVGTNTIRQNYSREGGLDYIVENDGTITEAVSSQVWSGDAVVHVSIVNWIKGNVNGKKKLFNQIGDKINGEFEVFKLNEINSSLSNKLDVTKAKKLRVNKKPKTCFQGQTHGHESFLLGVKKAKNFLSANKENSKVLYPYLSANNMLSHKQKQPERFVIDFHKYDVYEAKKFSELFQIVKENVLPDRVKKAEKEKKKNKRLKEEDEDARINKHHQNFLKTWWKLSYAREDMIKEIENLSRYIVCGQVTKRPIFDFVSSSIRPNASLMVFNFEDDYSYGVLQSSIHWSWFIAKCSTLKGDPRYTSTSVYETFPWPQEVTEEQVQAVAEKSKKLRSLRDSLMKENDMNLRELYRTMELPGENKLRDAHKKLDNEVRKAYGIQQNESILQFLLDLNYELAEKENNDIGGIIKPGLPDFIEDSKQFISEDCISPKLP